ncbi:MAG TPA: ABC transporter ATP-binding protein [Stellaceae bacterium]|nr:ABC transporter ATP-binding protein [Stellaceae bacterium]
MSALLSLEDVHAYYGDSHVLQGVSLSVPRGQVLSLLGRNGAGKTTTLKTIMGIVPPRAGRIAFDGQMIGGARPHRVARAGLGYVPETRGIFPSLSVWENLTLAAREGDESTAERWTTERVFELFPRLYERRQSGGGKLSGGEQQMLAIARALLTNPRLLLLDEPTEGLAPIVVDEIEKVLARLKGTGLSILLVEQNLSFALAFADSVAVLGKGRVRWTGTPAEFAAADEAKRRWLGV